MMQSVTTPSARLPASVCIGFGVGTVGVSIMLNAVTAYFPAFMSTVLGKNTEVAGYLLMGSKLYDAVADLIIGGLSDRTRTRWGRRRPYLLAGALISALSFLMIFSAKEMSDNALLIYMIIALVLYSTGYSLFNVPYIAMPSEMTTSRYERSRLLSFRTVFVSIGQILAIAGTAALISRGGGGRLGYLIMAWTMALVIATAMVLSFFGTAKAPIIERPSPKPTMQPSPNAFALILRNRPFCLLMAAKIFQFLAFSSMATTSLLFMLNVLHVGYGGQIQLALTQNVAAALSMPAWLWLERQIGKRNAYLVGIALMCVTSASWVIAGAHGIGLSGLIWRGVLGGIGSGGMILLSVSMLSDTFAYDRDLTGLQREGLLSSVTAVIEKTSFALGVAVIGVLLNLAHYVPTKNGQLVQQPTTAVNALYACFALLPVVLFGCNAICTFFYTLGGRSSQFLISGVDPEPAAV